MQVHGADVPTPRTAATSPLQSIAEGDSMVSEEVSPARSHLKPLLLMLSNVLVAFCTGSQSILDHAINGARNGAAEGV